MDIFKVSIKIILLFFFGCILSCKPIKKDKQEITKGHTQVKDTLPKYPEHLNKNYVLGKFDYQKDSSFSKVSKEFSNKIIYLRKETLNAFLLMQKSAKEENIHLKIISGTRNFEHQKRIWNYKWNEKYKNIPIEKRAKKILEFSSMPSTSRHHWGTDIDLISLSNSYFSFGKGKTAYDWLIKNASKFGFFQPYISKENGRTGYNEEKWHWSYAPLSLKYIKYYNENITYKDIIGFEGSKSASELKVIENYVNGIDKKASQIR